jgi:hypothetical protein
LNIQWRIDVYTQKSDVLIIAFIEEGGSSRVTDSLWWAGIGGGSHSDARNDGGREEGGRVLWRWKEHRGREEGGSS